MFLKHRGFALILDNGKFDKMTIGTGYNKQPSPQKEMHLYEGMGHGAGLPSETGSARPRAPPVLPPIIVPHKQGYFTGEVGEMIVRVQVGLPNAGRTLDTLLAEAATSRATATKSQ